MYFNILPKVGKPAQSVVVFKNMIKMNAKIVFISMVLDKNDIKISFMLPAVGTYV